MSSRHSGLTAAILCGGLGTRLRSVVSDRPKVLAEVAGQPFLTLLLRTLDEAGIRRVIFCTGYKAAAIRAIYGADFGALTIEYSHEDTPLGTGGALAQAARSVEGDLLALNGDSYCAVDFSALLSHHRSSGAAATLSVCEVADTAAFGIPIPTAGWFPELNLRFYVRRGEKRATVFLREFVPNALITLGARWLYHQPYNLALIQHHWRVRGDTIDIRTDFTFRDSYGSLTVQAENSPGVPDPGSQAHFLKEHYWGFDRAPDGQSFRYQVAHPVWRPYPVRQHDVRFNPGTILGGVWRDLRWNELLHSVLCAEGSAVKVYTAEALAAE